MLTILGSIIQNRDKHDINISGTAVLEYFDNDSGETRKRIFEFYKLPRDAQDLFIDALGASVASLVKSSSSVILSHSMHTSPEDICERNSFLLEQFLLEYVRNEETNPGP